MTKQRIHMHSGILATRFSRTTFCIGLALSLLACGESDLTSLQRDAIIEAQQQKLATQQENDDSELPAAEANADTSIQDAQQQGSGQADTDANSNSATVPQNMIDLSDYQIVFNENFNSGEINPAKWNTALRWGPNTIVNNEEQFYVDTLNNSGFGHNPFQINADSVAIRAELTPQELLEDANNQAYLSGVLTTADKFDFTHGIAEMRAQVPAGQGLWSQFWLLPDEFIGLRPQLFVMEFLGDQTDSAFHTYKYQDENDDLQTSGVLRTRGENFSADFHTYAVEWSPGELIFYIDGFEVQRISSDNIASQNLYLIINLAVGGWQAGSPDDSTPFPAELVIDHVRVFQQLP